MLDKLNEWDHHLFYLINNEWANGFFDALMPWLRNKYLWAPLYLFIIVFLLRNYRISGIYMLIYLAVVVLLCDQISNTIKLVIERYRPCQEEYWQEYIRVLVGCGKSFSFPSNHAANHFGVATFLGVLFWGNTRLILPIAFAWAGIISFAQVYVGVHYPADVTAGAVLGMLIGLGLAKLLKRHLV